MIEVFHYETNDDQLFEPVYSILSKAYLPKGRAEGVLEGKQLQPRPMTEYAVEAGFNPSNIVDLIIMVATGLSESQGFDRAHNDNIDDATNKVISRDCGVNQINIPASKIGTDEEEQLYDPLYNYQRAYILYQSRGFKPWVGYTSGVAMRPDWWHYSLSRQVWVPTGRYIHKGIRGVANYLALREFDIVSPADKFSDFYKIPTKPTVPPS